MDNKIYVIGLLIEKYIGRDEGFDSDGEVRIADVESERYILMLKRGFAKFELTLWNSYGMCPSGWTTASWGNYRIKKVNNFRPFSHVPTEEIILEGATIENEEGYFLVGECNDSDEDEIRTNVFSYSEDGGDGWYPMGGVSVNVSLFKETKRAFKKRPVWIFSGNSGTGKSTIGTFSYRGGCEVFETDSVDVLPEFITEEIIIIGNKKEFSVEEIKRHLFGSPEVILVNFERGA